MAFLRIARHGAGPGAMYVITYHRLDHLEGSRPRPVAGGKRAGAD